ARLPRARSERLRPHRSPHGRGGARVRAGGEPEPEPRLWRGLRRVRRGQWRLLRTAARADHHARLPLGARANGMITTKAPFGRIHEAHEEAYVLCLRGCPRRAATLFSCLPM